MATEIFVNTSGFQGDHVVLDLGVTPNDKWDSFSHPITGKMTDPFKVSTKECAFHVRGAVGSSRFTFKLDKYDKIIEDSIQPPNAASIDPADLNKKTLLLNTQKVAIRPSNYPGKYLTNLLSHPSTKNISMGQSGSMEELAITDIGITIWNGSSRGASMIYATICKGKCVCVHTPGAALGGDNELIFRTSEITIFPMDNQVFVSGYDVPFIKPGIKEIYVTVIRGLDTEVTVQTITKPIKKSQVLFKPLE